MEQQKKQSNLLELVDACETYHFNSGDPDDDIRLLKAQELRELGFIAKAEELETELNRKIKLSRIENEKYIAISDEMIQKFLNKKAERYDADHKPKLKPETERADEYTVDLNPIRRMREELYRRAELSGRAFMAQRQQAQQESLLIESLSRQSQVMQDFYSSTPSLWSAFLGRTGKANTFVAQTVDFYSAEEGTIGKYEWQEENISTYKGIPPENVLEVLKEHKDKQLFDYFTIASVNAVKDPLLLGRIEGVKERFFIAQWGIDVSLDDIL